MKLSITVIVILLLTQIFAAPLRTRRQGKNRSCEPPGKIQKCETDSEGEVVPYSQNDDEAVEPQRDTVTIAPEANKCYFHKDRTSEKEKKERPQKSKVSRNCGGELTSMKKLINDDKGNLLGGSNKADLALCRGAGACDINWDDPDAKSEWKTKFICKEHEKELVTDWDNQKYKHKFLRTVTRKPLCSMPEGTGFPHKTRVLTLTRLELQVPEANALLEKEGLLAHPGIPLCPQHKEYVKKTQAQFIVESTGREIDPLPDNGLLSQSQEFTSEGFHSCKYSQQSTSDTEYCEQPIKNIHPTVSNEIANSFYSFAKVLGIERVRPLVGFKDLTPRSKRRKAAAGRQIMNVVVEIMAPEDTEELRRMMADPTAQNIWTSKSDNQLDALLKYISGLFIDGECKEERILSLSIIANLLPMEQIREYIPGLSSYYYKKARRFARAHRLRDIVTNIKERYDKKKVTSFVDFITSPLILTGLPNGSKKVTLSDGTIIEIPNTIRSHRSTTIIEMYKKFLEQKERTHLLMSDSTMYRILEFCSATRRQSTACVDYFVADGAEAVEELLEISENWFLKQEIDKSWMDMLKRGIKETLLYLRTDFSLHVKNMSRIADHCATHALSDPVDSRHFESCNSIREPHNHDLRCDRCDMIKSVLGDYRDTIKKILQEVSSKVQKSPTPALISRQEELLNHQECILRSEDAILELKKHMLRAKITDDQRADIIENLKDGEAFLTVDWAQKFLPMKYRERQSEYFGKKGISYHVTHCLSKQKGEVTTHTFVHILRSDVQDSNAVTLILESVLHELYKVGMYTVTIRADNAGCYHSSSTIASVPFISTTTGVTIKRFSFSEPQNGKSSADRAISHVKRLVKDYVDSGNDASTHDEFFNAITNRPMKGLSVYLISLSNTKKSDTKLPGISNYFDFIFNPTGVTAYRYYGIGTGEFISKDDLQPNLGQITEDKEGGFYYSRWTSSNIHYWYIPKSSPLIAHEELDRDNSKVVLDDDTPLESENSEISTLFECPEEGCTASFITHANLEKHVVSGKHKIVPQRITIRDFAINAFARTIEENIGSQATPYVANAISSLDSTTLDYMENKPVGWALKSKKLSKRFSEDVKNFLKECFETGISTGTKLNPIYVAKMMVSKKNTDGSKTFPPDECLSARQIQSYFSRLTAEQRNPRPKRAAEKENEQEDDMTNFDLELGYRKDEFTTYPDDEYYFIIEKNKEKIFEMSVEETLTTTEKLSVVQRLHRHFVNTVQPRLNCWFFI